MVSKKKVQSKIDSNTTISVDVLKELFNNKSKYKISEDKGHQGITSNDYGGVQAEYNERFVYYRHPQMPNNLFLRETYHTDSYGYNETINSIDFVEGREEITTVYKPI